MQPRKSAQALPRAVPGLRSSRLRKRRPPSPPSPTSNCRLCRYPAGAGRTSCWMRPQPRRAADPESARPRTRSSTAVADAPRSNPTSVSVDNANIRLAFGGRAGGRMRSSSLMGPAANEAAILEVTALQHSRRPQPRPAPASRPSSKPAPAPTSCTGRASFSIATTCWGAQNPFTQWVKQTAPGTSTTVPVFTPFPYTAPEHEDRWGIGMGSRIKRRKLFWFAAYDGSRRNNPGVASVRHPDNFFAQPANDEMQVLSARLGLSSVNPVAEGLAAYSGILESLAACWGPRTRTANQWVGFGRLDWHAAERHRFTLEGHRRPLELSRRRPHPRRRDLRKPQLWNQPGKRTLAPGSLGGVPDPQPARRDPGIGGPPHLRRGARHALRPSSRRSTSMPGVNCRRWWSTRATDSPSAIRRGSGPAATPTSTSTSSSRPSTGSHRRHSGESRRGLASQRRCHHHGPEPYRDLPLLHPGELRIGRAGVCQVRPLRRARSASTSTTAISAAGPGATAPASCTGWATCPAIPTTPRPWAPPTGT